MHYATTDLASRYNFLRHDLFSNPTQNIEISDPTQPNPRVDPTQVHVWRCRNHLLKIRKVEGKVAAGSTMWFLSWSASSTEQRAAIEKLLLVSTWTSDHYYQYIDSSPSITCTYKFNNVWTLNRQWIRPTDKTGTSLGGGGAGPGRPLPLWFLREKFFFANVCVI